MPTKALGASSPASDRERVGSSWSEGVIISRMGSGGWAGGRGEGQRNHRTHPSGSGRSPEAPSRVSIRSENGQCSGCPVGTRMLAAYLRVTTFFIMTDRGKGSHPFLPLILPAIHLLLWYVVRVGARTQSVAKKCEAGEQEDLGAHLIV